MAGVLAEVEPGESPPPSPEAPGGAPEGAVERLRLVLTLRNPPDQPAVLTGFKLVVHETYRAPACGNPHGGGVLPSRCGSSRGASARRPV